MSSRMKRELFGSIHFNDKHETDSKRTLAMILSEAGFEFKKVEPETDENKIFKRSTSSVLRSMDYSLLGGERYHDNQDGQDSVTVDGRTAAIGEPSYSINRHTDLFKTSDGRPIKHNPVRYGGTYFGGEGSHTTKSPFRYTSKYYHTPSTTPATTGTNTETEPSPNTSDTSGLSTYTPTNNSHSSLLPTASYKFYQLLRDKSELTESIISPVPVTTNVELATAESITTEKSTKQTNSILIELKHPLTKMENEQTTKPSTSKDSSTKQTVKTTTHLDILPLSSSSTVEIISKPIPSSTAAPIKLLYDGPVPNKLVDPEFDLALKFKQTGCRKKDVVKLSCGDLKCGVRPQALSNMAR